MKVPGGIPRHTPGSRQPQHPREENLGERRDRGGAEQPGEIRRLLFKGGISSCGVLAVAHQRPLDCPCCKGHGYGYGYQDDSDPADIDAANLEAKGSKSQGALGRALQVGADS